MIGRCWSPKTGRAYLGTRPSRKSIQRFCREISERTDRRTRLLDPEQQVARLNRMLVGWANYFHLGPMSQAYRRGDNHARARLRQWLRRKRKVQSRGAARFPYSYLSGIARYREKILPRYRRREQLQRGDVPPMTGQAGR
jgi:RNA-directed DNA polymerase